MALGQLDPGAIVPEATEQQPAVVVAKASQPGAEPGKGRIGPGFAAGGRQQFHQGLGAPIHLGNRFIEAPQPEGLLQPAGVLEPPLLNPEGFGQGRIPQGSHALLQPLRLELFSLGLERAQAMGTAQGLMTITEVVLHAPPDRRHGVGTQGGTTVTAVLLDRLDQTEAAKLEQIVEAEIGLTGLLAGDAGHQRQVGLHHGVALIRRAVLVVLPEQAAVELQRLLGATERKTGHG